MTHIIQSFNNYPLNTWMSGIPHVLLQHWAKDTACPHELPTGNEGWMQHRHQQQIKRCLFVYSTVGLNNGKEYWDNQNQSVGGNSTLNKMLRAGLRSDPNLKWRPHTWCDAGNGRLFLMSTFTVTLEGFWKACPGSLNVVLEVWYNTTTGEVIHLKYDCQGLEI